MLKYREKAEHVFLPSFPDLEFEHKFCVARNWRFDIALTAHRVAIEVDGGTWMAGGGGRHNQPKGYAEDINKLNAAAFHGWRVFRCLPSQLTRTCNQVREFLEAPAGYCEGIGEECRSAIRKRKLPKRKF